MIDTMTIHIFLEVGLHDTRKLEFASDEVSGLQIKEKGGVPLDDDLALRHGQQLGLVKNDQVITIRNGEHLWRYRRALSAKRASTVTAECVARLMAELKAEYSEATSACDGTRTLVKLPTVRFPSGCSPQTTEALVVLDPGAPKPALLVRSQPKLANGVQTSLSVTAMAGESWFSYSFNLQWDEQRHTAVQFVEGMLRRFARSA